MATQVSATTTGRVELWLVAEGDGERREVAVEVDSACTMGELVEAVAAHLGVQPDDARIGRGGGTPEAIDPRRPVVAAGLRSGDVVVLGGHGAGAPVAPPAPPAPDAVALVVAGGPDMGRRIVLAPGEHTVGREAPVTIADPSLSRRHLAITVSGGAATVADAGSANGTLVDGLPVTAARPLADGELVRAGRTLLRVEPAVDPARRYGATVVRDGAIPFNRPPRVRRSLPAGQRRIPSPPDDPQPPRIPLVTAALPLILGIVMYLVMKNAMFLMFSLLAPVMAVGSYMEDKRGGRGRQREKAREFREHVEHAVSELELARTQEAEALRALAPDAAVLAHRAHHREPGLWERRPEDDDFLALRVGTGDKATGLEVAIDMGGSQTLRREAEQRIASMTGVVDVPVLAEAAKLGPVGVCGPRERVDALARWLAVQAATLHSPRDLLMVAALPGAEDGEWSWLRWLPHVRGSASASVVEHEHLAADYAGADGLVKALVALVRQRAEEDKGLRAGRSDPRPVVLALFDERVAPDASACAELLKAGPALNVHAIWLGSAARSLPGECRTIVELDGGPSRLTVVDAVTGAERGDVSADGMSLELAREVALALAPVRDVSAAGAAGQVPRSIGLMESLGAVEPLPDWVQARWSVPREGREAVIGAAGSGPLVVDLRTDGPHALIGGTTGAGKSELLQTLVAALAATHPPERLTFLLVDYKGGAAFKDCIALPHVVGFVTDLDAHLTERALISLNAELKRREEILREHGARDLVEMEQRAPEHAPPSLAIVIDEFATLVKEVPDFVDGVVDVAQRGRSLGVHLVLATQRPAGAVSENIRANVNLRIALRMSDGAASSDVIDDPGAARIPRSLPGRAYLRTGPSELVEFQTAYAAAVAGPGDERPPVLVRDLGPSREDRPADTGAPPVNAEAPASDLERVVGAAVRAFAARAGHPPRKPWLDPLPEVVGLGELAAREDAPAGTDSLAVLGLLDEPDRQVQRVDVHDFETEGSLLVFGAGGTGKTVLLRTIAASMASSTSPEELWLYGLDFASQGLAPVAALPHCGGVVGGDDAERVRRMFRMLRKEIEDRRRRFAEIGAFSLPEYRSRLGRDAPPVPRVVVLFDGYGSFYSTYEKVDLGELVDALPRLVADGRGVGVHFVITNDRRGGVQSTLTGIIPSVLVFRMANDDEYSLLGLDVRSLKDRRLPAGRGFHRGLEVHGALVGREADGVSQVEAYAALAAELRGRFGEGRVPKVGVLPARVPRDGLGTGISLQVPLGLGDEELAPVAVDLGDGHVLICGPYRSGRTTALATVVDRLRATHPAMEVHLLAPRRSALTELDGWASVSSGEEACVAAVPGLREIVSAREPGGIHPVVVIVIDDADELAESMAGMDLEAIVKRGRDVDVRIVAAAETQSVLRAYSGYLRELKKDEQGVLLDPDVDVDGDVFGVRLPRRQGLAFPPGRGYLVRRGVIEGIQVGA